MAAGVEEERRGHLRHRKLRRVVREREGRWRRSSGWSHRGGEWSATVNRRRPDSGRRGILGESVGQKGKEGRRGGCGGKESFVRLFICRAAASSPGGGARLTGEEWERARHVAIERKAWPRANIGVEDGDVCSGRGPVAGRWARHDGVGKRHGRARGKPMHASLLRGRARQGREEEEGVASRGG